MDPTKDRFGISKETPPDISSALESIGDANTRTLIEQKFNFHAEREKELRAKLEQQDDRLARTKLDAYIERQEAEGSAALRAPALKPQAVETPSFHPEIDDPSARGLEVAVHPEMTAMVFNIHLLMAVNILSNTKASEESLLMAHRSALNAYEYARKSNSKTLLARSHFYTGLLAFRRGSLRDAIDFFKEVIDANEPFFEYEWAQKWLSECEDLVNRGDASLGNTPVGASPVSAGAD